MKRHEATPRRKALAGAVVAMLAMAAGSAFAAVPSTTDYLNASRPMITGKAISVNEHQVVVATEQDEVVVLALDTRTLVPVDVAPGMMMRVEFKTMEDGRRVARRIIPIRTGTKAGRELAYSTERAGGEDPVRYASTSDGEDSANDPGRASTALSATNQSLGTSLEATPSTDAYRVAMQPMIAGRVVTVNDHRIVVDTDQGQQVALEMDSGTIVPTDLASDMTVRVDYRSMEYGPKYAERITPIKGRMDTGRATAYQDTPENAVVAQNASAPPPIVTGEPTSPPRQEAEEPTSLPQQENAEPESLPQTASSQPLIALLGCLSLAAAGAMAIGRRFRTA